MKLEEYKAKIESLKQEFDLKKREIAIEYAFANNTIKEGDIITDHIGSIKVETVKSYINLHGVPECAYYGVEYTKKGEQKKSGSKRRVYQCNITVK